MFDARNDTEPDGSHVQPDIKMPVSGELIEDGKVEMRHSAAVQSVKSKMQRNFLRCIFS